MIWSKEDLIKKRELDIKRMEASIGLMNLELKEMKENLIDFKKTTKES